MEKREYNWLDRVDSPRDLKRLSLDELRLYCDELRHYIIEQCAVNPGHLASSLGAVELAAAVHYVFDTPDDRLVWDVGHQAYAHKIITGRREAFRTNRKLGGISGFPRIAESPYDAFGGGHSSVSISAAFGMAKAAELRGEKRQGIAVIGDGALTGGMAVEALNHAGVYKKDLRLLIILNDNDHSISPPAGALSGHLAKLVSTAPVWKAREISKSILKPVPLLWDFAKRVEKQTVNFLSPPSTLFSSFDINYFGPIDGHDVAGLVSFLKNLKALDGPIVLHVKTKKGKGYKPAEDDPTLYHGVGRFDPAVGIQPSAAPKKKTYTQIFSDWICDTAETDPKLYAITPAMREGSGLVEFEKRFPERYRDVAIAEQHAVTFAAGLACAGMHPVVAIYSTFAQRAYDQIVHDVAIQNLPVLFAIDRGGIVGADGKTHHGLFDIALLRSLPNMTVAAPSDENEMRLLLNTAWTLDTPVAVRYPRGTGPGTEVTAGNEAVAVGKSKTVRSSAAPKGKRVAILAFGSMVWRLASVAEALDATLIDMRFVKPLDKEAILKAASEHDLIVTAEEGVKAGGAGSGVLEVLSDAGSTVRTLVLGVPDEFVDHGSTEVLLERCGLDPVHVQAKIESLLG